MKNKIGDLRNHLFEVLERLKDPDEKTPMTIDTAKAIVGVAETIIDSARVENEYIRNLASMYNNGTTAQVLPKSEFLLLETPK